MLFIFLHTRPVDLFNLCCVANPGELAVRTQGGGISSSSSSSAAAAVFVDNVLLACLLPTHWRYGKRRRRLHIVGGDQEEDLPGPWRVHTSYGMAFDGPRTHDEDGQMMKVMMIIIIL